MNGLDLADLYHVESADDDEVVLRRLADGSRHAVPATDFVCDDDVTHDTGGVVEGVLDDGVFLCERAIGDHRIEYRTVGEPRRRRLTIDGFEKRVSFADAAEALGVAEHLLNGLTGRSIPVLLIDGQPHLIPLPEETRDQLEEEHEAELRRERENRKQAEAQQERERLRQRRRDPERFVNPYTFVDIPDATGMIRAEPNGHRRLGNGLLMGRLRVTWHLCSPLLYRRPADGERNWRLWRDNDDRPGLPGSSVKGAIRSLHETLFGGCLRVLDLDQVAVHREPAHVNPGTLAMVTGHEPDGSITVETCDEVRWLHHDALLACLGSPEHIRTGTRLRITGPPQQQRYDRDEHLDATGLVADPDGSWILLVTDAGARRPDHAVFFAAGHLSGHRRTLRRSVVDVYRREAAGSDDERQSHDGEVRVDIDRGGRRVTLGYRQPVRRDLPEGTVIWIRDRDGRIARSTIWRRSGQHPVGERVDPAWYPCGAPPHTDTRLCPSCRLFGSAGEEQPHQGGDRRTVNYRGHIRFGPAVAPPHTEPTSLQLAPLGTPNISSGQFYLHNRTGVHNNDANTPLSHWGSQADAGTPRRIRGRKFYWHGFTPDTPGRPARQQRRDHQAKNMSATVELLPQGTTLTCEISFDGLSPTQLGQLVAALDPARVLTSLRDHPLLDAEEWPVRIRLGGGRPFGLGTAETRCVTLVEVHDAASRWANQPQPDIDLDRLVEQAIDETPAPVRATWSQLAAVLSDGWAPPDRIWYPPGDPWSNGAVHQRFDQSYRFFQVTNGQHFARADDHPLLPLPPADRHDPTLPIVNQQRPPAEYAQEDIA